MTYGQTETEYEGTDRVRDGGTESLLELATVDAYKAGKLVALTLLDCWEDGEDQSECDPHGWIERLRHVESFGDGAGIFRMMEGENEAVFKTPVERFFRLAMGRWSDEFCGEPGLTRDSQHSMSSDGEDEINPEDYARLIFGRTVTDRLECDDCLSADEESLIDDVLVNDVQFLTGLAECLAYWS
jgi:hypothetical protein